MLFAFKATLMLLGLAQVMGGEIKNVFGADLDTCSKPGKALTGFTRDGHCQDSGNDDEGSHHICIEMKSDFCTQTGQPNWCEDKMPCMGQSGDCEIGNWCVCQWAFARYIQMAGGCDSIVDLVCDATNMAALKAYEKEASNDKSIQDALDCLRKRCNVAAGATALSAANVPPISPAGFRSSSGKTNVAMTAAAAFAGFAVLAIALRNMRVSQVQCAE